MRRKGWRGAGRRMERKLLGVYGNVLCVALLAMAKYTHHRCVYSSKKYFISYYSQHGFFLFLPLQSSLGLYVLALCSLVACFSILAVSCSRRCCRVLSVADGDGDGGGWWWWFCRILSLLVLWLLVVVPFLFCHHLGWCVCACAFFTSHT